MNFHVTPHWTFEDALPLVRAIQPETRNFKYHLTLGGGVLNNGKSDKDLDLYFLPMFDRKRADWRGLLEYLEKQWGKSSILGRDYPDTDLYAVAAKFTYGGLRIDSFILGGDDDETKKFREERLRAELDLDEGQLDPPVVRARTPAFRPFLDGDGLNPTPLGDARRLATFDDFLRRQREAMDAEHQVRQAQRATNIRQFYAPIGGGITTPDNEGRQWTFTTTNA